MTPANQGIRLGAPTEWGDFMAIATEAPKAGFRPSMLIYDTRFRSATIQVIVLILVLLGLSWLIHNLFANLAAKGKDLSYAFLWRRAGYDIGQHLIPYTNDSTHGRAAIVGLLNTLLVASLACVFATVLGVVVGVLRLSKNWLISHLAAGYVESHPLSIQCLSLRKRLLHIIRCSPICRLRYVEPVLQRWLGRRVLLPKFDQTVASNDPHEAK